MSIGSALALGAQGIQAGMNRTAIAAGRIAGGVGGGFANDPDAASLMVGLQQGAIETRASAAVVKSVDQMLGTLIDLRV